MKKVINFFAREHLFGNLLTLLCFVIGIYSLYSIRRDIWPSVDYDLTQINTILPGASPQQIESLLLSPIEDALKEVENLKSVYSVANDNQVITYIELDSESRSSTLINDDIQKAIDRISSFPTETNTPVVTSIDSGQQPVIEVTIIGNKDPLQLRDYAKSISDRLKEVPGVARISKKGLLDKEYIIEADNKKLAQHNTSLGQLINVIKNRNISLPAGTSFNQDNAEVSIRTEHQYHNIEQIKNTVLRANEAGNYTSIKDIADVYLDLAKPQFLYRTNGQASINLVVSKKATADALTLVSDIKNEILKLNLKYKGELVLETINDYSIYLANRLGALSANLLLGLLFVIFILKAFLPWSVTFVVTLGIPVALFTTIAIAQAMGLSLNLLSLMGLILVLGMIVDDAIVVCENIWRHLEMNKPPIQAVTDGAYEVFIPVLASILTTVAAFAPMLFMSGIFGRFIFEIPIMVILALFVSLFEAFIIMPSHFSFIVKPRKKEVLNKKHWFNYFIKKYSSYLKWSLKHRYIITLATIIFTAGVFFTFFKVGYFKLFPPGGIETFFVSLEAETGTPLKVMERYVIPIEKQINNLLNDRVLQDYSTSIGVIQQNPMDPLTQFGPNYAHIRVNLTPQKDRVKTAEDVINDLQNNIIKPQGLIKLSYDLAKQGPPQGRDISLNILGNDFSVLKQISQNLKIELKQLQGVHDIRDSLTKGIKEWQVIPDERKSAMSNLNTAIISQSVRAAFEGISPSSIRTANEEIDLRIKLKSKQAPIKEQLNSLLVGNSSGQLIKLKEVATFKPSESLSKVVHENYKRVLNVSANIKTKELSPRAANALLRTKIPTLLKNYPDYDIQFAGEDKDTQESMQSLLKAFSLAALFIFFLLIIIFRNILQPLVILTTIPLGICGVIISLLIHGRPMSFLAMLGVIALAGVIVNNSIVFLDFVNKNRKLGHSIDQSIINAASTRLRPIVITTVTTIIGLLPTAYGSTFQNVLGIGGQDPFIIPMALALSWGLGIGSLLISLSFPAVIRIVDDIINLYPFKSS